MKGIIASPGVAIAKAFVLAHPEVVIDEKLVAAQDVEKEVEKFREAVAKTEDQLNGIIAITEERRSAKEADVFRAHLMMLADPMFEEAVLDKIQNSNFNAGKAVSEATAEVETYDARLLEKLNRLAEKYPDQIQKTGERRFIVPKRCVSVREPYSAERRKAASDRAKAAGYMPPVRKFGS